jgi:putative membrane protein
MLELRQVMQIGPGNSVPGETAALPRVPWWRRAVRNGVTMGLLALAAILLIGGGDLSGLGNVLAELPAGLAVSAAVHLPQILLTAKAWQSLLPPGTRPEVGVMVQLRWYREAANVLLPAGALIGQVTAARLLARRGVPADLAGATAAVDFTLEAVSQLIFTMTGVALLLAKSADRALADVAIAGLGIAAVGAVAMVIAQRHFLSPTERLLALLARRWPALRPERISLLQQSVLRLHMDWRGLGAALLWHGGAWVLGAFEIVGVLELLGQPVSLADALVVESLAQALRNVGFMLPGAFGAQEGAIVGAAVLVGVSPGVALAAALVRRAREVTFAIPGLVAWH